MNRTFPARSRWLFAALVFASIGLAASTAGGRPAPSGRTPFQPSTYNYYIINPASPAPSPNVVTGVNQDGNIVGVYGSACSGSSPYTSWISTDKGPPWTKFKLDNFSSAAGTYLTSLDTDEQDNGAAGWVCSPSGHAGTYGAINPVLGGTWYLVPPTVTGPNAVTEILGLNDWVTGVGFYNDTGGVAHAFAVNCPGLICSTTPTSHFTPTFGQSTAKAVDMNTKGDVVGVMTVGGTVEGWFYAAGNYFALQMPGGSNTTPYGINWQDNIVGTYSVSGVEHGFLITDPRNVAGNSEQFDVPGAASGSTVLTDINNHGCISGSYVNSSGVQQGFVAMPQSDANCTGPPSGSSPSAH
jgi:hypothetical protein